MARRDENDNKCNLPFRESAVERFWADIDPVSSDIRDDDGGVWINGVTVLRYHVEDALSKPSLTAG